MWPSQPPEDSNHSEPGTGDQERIYDPGIEPIKPLALVQNAVNERQRRACVQKYPKGCLWLWLRYFLSRYAEIYANHQYWRHKQSVPEDPMPGEIGHVPRFKR